VTVWVAVVALVCTQPDGTAVTTWENPSGLPGPTSACLQRGPMGVQGTERSGKHPSVVRGTPSPPRASACPSNAGSISATAC
jgi:hypothetical protein